MIITKFTLPVRRSFSIVGSLSKGFLIFLLTIHTLHAILDYDRAIIQTQKNNWPVAQELLTNVIIDNPDRPDTLYDLGVAAYKNNNFDTALTYFNKAANHKNANTQLQQQAHFNVGNTLVQLKQLQQAIDAYDHVLAINPHHEQALHNKEVVKKMMEQQKEQDKDKNNQDQNKNQDDKEEQNKDNQDKQNQKQDKQEQQDKKEENQNQDKQEQNKQDHENQNQDQQDQKKEEPKNESQGQQQKENSQESEKQKQNQPDKKDGAGNKPEPKPADHQKDKESADQSQTGTGSKSAQDQNKKQPEPKLSAGLARVLEDREKKDAQLNKQMTKALVANQGGGKNDYNCW